MLSAIEGFRLSPQQRRVWLLQQAERQFPYRAQCTVHITGPLDHARLRRALARVVGRHEILRTTFRCPPGMRLPVQIVDAAGAAAFETADLRSLAPEEQSRQIARFASTTGERAAAMKQGAIVRALEAALADAESVLLLDLPALCADAITVSNLAVEIARAYADDRGDGQAEGIDDVIQYADVAEVFNDLLESDDTAVGRRYWEQQRFAELMAQRFLFVEPPASQAQPAESAAFAPRAVRQLLPSEAVAALTARADADALPVSAFCLAGWLALLSRLTGAQEALAGVSYTGRLYEGLDAAIGLFERALPLHAALNDRLSFGDFARSVARSMANLSEWQDYFQLKADADASLAPFIPFGFSFEQAPAPIRAADLIFRLDVIGAITDRFVVKLVCTQQSDRLALSFLYDANTIAAAQIERLADQYLVVLRQAAGDPLIALRDLEIVSDQERRLLHELNATATPFPQDRCIHELFAEQATRTPDTVAVIAEGRETAGQHTSASGAPSRPGVPAAGPQHITYQALNLRANQLAHHLQVLGVGPETRVGIDAIRSGELIVGLLGVLKAGGAYVPLDPAAPAARRALILHEAQARALITIRDEQQAANDDERGARGVASLPAPDIIDLKVDWTVIAQQPSSNPINQAHPENLAYSIYTSGSTGKPKGVMIQHRSAVNLASALHKTIYQEYAQPLRISMNGPATFDTSVKQIVQLLHGGTLTIVPDHARLEGDKLLAFIRRQRLDALDCTPWQARALLAAGLAQGHPTDLKLALVGGEAIDLADWRSMASAPCPAFINVYGPTECTVDALVSAVAASPAHPSLGKPLANVAVYVLDPHMRLTPLGAPGELYIGGAGVARGYLDRPDLTAAAFVPNPFGTMNDEDRTLNEPHAAFSVQRSAFGARLYRTGDRARWLPDRQIQFLGRTDQQVKLRGLRIELGEIEAALREHPNVRECVVVVREETSGDKRLAAYIVPDARQAAVGDTGAGGTTSSLAADPSSALLRTFLRERLPEYMTPAYLVLLDQLPLNRHGKIDRHALPDPQAHALAQQRYEAPRNQAEHTIAAIWAEALQIEKVGINVNFFDLGGHSLLMVQVCDKVQEAFKRELSLVEMFRHPTVSALALYLDHEPASAPLQTVDERAQRQMAARERQQQRVRQRREGS